MTNEDHVEGIAIEITKACAEYALSRDNVKLQEQIHALMNVLAWTGIKNGVPASELRRALDWWIDRATEGDDSQVIAVACVTPKGTPKC
jgi:hypothetical protein